VNNVRERQKRTPKERGREPPPPLPLLPLLLLLLLLPLLQTLTWYERIEVVSLRKMGMSGFLVSLLWSYSSTNGQSMSRVARRTWGRGKRVSV
jgi:hypothetical protein